MTLLLGLYESKLVNDQSHSILEIVSYFVEVMILLFHPVLRIYSIFMFSK